jgi:hypothetical protein
MGRMLGQRARRENGAVAVALMLLAAACFGPVRRDVEATRLPAVMAALQSLPEVRYGELRALPSLPAGGGVLVVDDRASPTASALTPEGLAALQAFVAGGGRLALFGHAAALVTALGVEPETPEATTFRWGFDARAVAGRAELGFQVVSGKLPELFADDALAADANAPLLLAGDAPCTAPLCAWTIGLPRAGATLARLATRRDGADDPAGAPVVVHWEIGAGAVLACGLLPRADHPDERVRAAAVGFLQRTAAWAARGRACVVLADDAMAVPAAPPPLPPMAPLVPNWGWQIPQQSGGGERTADEVVADVLQPSWLAGADVAMVEVGDAAGAVPLPWSTEDPLRPAPSFRARPPGAWHDAALRSVALEAHGRSMAAFAALEPLPVGDRAVERLVALRFLARELACVRRFGPGAFDGFALPSWSLDRAGRTLAMAQDFQPAARVALLGEVAPEVGGALRALDADDGALRDLPFAGLADGWRSEGFAAATFAVGALDARGGSVGGGRATTPDWIVAQANAFARARAGQGAAMWWRRHDAATLPGDLADYVEGCSLEPLRAAVAMPLAATGQDGLRAAGASLVVDAPAGFAAAVPAPAVVHALQNNWFRLLGSGGALAYDPSGRADFGAGALQLSPAFLRTRLFGARPDASSLRHERLDLLARGFAGEGGHRDERFVDLTTPTSPLPPAQLAVASAPTWPSVVRFQVELDFGYHELDVAVRPTRGRGLLVVTLDGVLLRTLPFDAAAGTPVAATVPVHAASKGARTLAVEAVAAGACALERLVLTRAGDVGVEAAVATPAGSFASLRESSQSTYHAEVVTLDAMADLPGFVVKARCERTVRNLQVERALALPAHDQLAAAKGETADDLRTAFVLSRRAGGVPDVVVVPMQRARHDTLRWRSGELTWRSAPDAGMQTRFGVLFVPAGEGLRRRDEAIAVLGGLADPAALDFREHRAATLQGATSFPALRLLRIDGAASTPFFVQEEGWWTMRGSQRGPDGARWLRIRETPGEVVQIVDGPSALARTRPGPGSLRLVALREPEPLSVTARVLQPSALGAPSVVMARDFADVQVDGDDWAFHDGRTIFLPNRAAEFFVRARDHAGGKGPHVRRTAAPLTVCRYLAGERTLVLATAGASGRPAELPWTAVLGGPRPVGIENGEIVDEGSLRFPDAAAVAAARAGGTLIRFGDGVCRVRFAD